MKKIIFAAIISILPLLAFAQDTGKKQAYLFYGEQCPHCKKVDEYFQANGIFDKYKITKLEFSNPFNARLLLKFGEAFNDPNKGSVPAMAFGDKFLVGDQPIMDNFVSEIDAAENANELPDPDKVGKTETSKDAPDGKKTSEGNKKNFFPVVLIALVFVGGGALVFINRKKN